MKTLLSICALLILLCCVSPGQNALPQTTQSVPTGTRAAAKTINGLWVTAYYPTFAYCDLLPQQIDYKAITHLIVFCSEPDTVYPYMREMVHPNDSASLETGVPGWCYNPASNNNTNGITHQSIMRDSCRANGVQFILCLGGEVGNNANRMLAIVQDTVKQDAYVAAVMGYINRHGFNGIDIDWEYPSTTTKTLFGRMLRKFRAELDKMSPRGTLSLAVDKWDYTGRLSPADANAYVDQINIMQYGMGEASYSGYNSPIARPNLPNYNAWTIEDHGPKLWKSLGYDSTKIGMLIPFECKSWTGVDGPGQTGGGYPGFDSYSTILTKLAQYPANATWDPIAKVPGLGYTENGVKHWLSYEDSQSIPIKVQYARDQHIGGVGVWELWRGWLKSKPAGQQDPLLQSLKKAVYAGTMPPPPVDSVSPTVAVSTPHTGDTLKTTPVAVSVTASDNVGVTSVDLVVNGQTVATDYSTPYTFSWNVTGLSGAQTISAKARDAAGHVTTSTAVSVVVALPPKSDSVAPSVALSAPKNGDTLRTSPVTVSATASDNVAVTSVQFVINGQTVATDTAAPYTYNWNTSALSGTQTILARAYDAAGNMGTSSTFQVVVALPPPPPDTISNTATLRDNFDGPDGLIAGRARWAPILNSFAHGALAIWDSAAQAVSDSGLHNFGGNVWDTLMSAGSEASVLVTAKSGDAGYSSCFLYGKMNSKDYNTGTGYRLRYLEQSGTDVLEIQRVGTGYANAPATLAHVNAELNVGDQLTFRVLSDNRTLVGLINNTIVITAVDSAYMPQQWYFALRSCVFQTPFRIDNFKVSSSPLNATLTAPVLQSPASGTSGVGATVSLSWGAVSGASAYHVQISADSLFGTLFADSPSVNATSLSVSGLQPGTKYFWRVAAVSGALTGPYSSSSPFVTAGVTAVLSTDKSTVDFGTVAIGKVKNDSLLITNHGTKVINILQVQSTAVQFVASPTSLQLSPNASKKLYITFIPDQKMSYAGFVITLTDSSGLTDTVVVKGKGGYPPKGSRNKTAISFGSVSPGVAAIDSFTVTNTGDLSLSLAQVQSTSTSFTVQPSSATIAPSDSQRFYVSTTTSVSGAVSAYIVFNGNGSPAQDSMSVKILSVSDVRETVLPVAYALAQNYPNPFNPTTTIEYSLPAVSQVTITVFDLLGREVSKLFQGVQNAGVQAVQWDATDAAGAHMPSGVYLYRITALKQNGEGTAFSAVRKMVLLK